MINENDILTILSATNQWWRSGNVTQDYAKPVKRFAYYEAMKILTHPDIRRMVLLTGARRIGKTTIMYQMIDALIQQGIKPERILYVSLDHPMLKLSSINEILKIYQQNIYPLDDVYCFFDEIQYADSWDSWLKTLYDTNKQCRIVATGSASPILVDKASESGVGRWTTLAIPTMSFYEYCGLLKLDLPEFDPDLKPTNLRTMPEREQNAIFQKLLPLLPHFNRYLLVGGFPELALSKDEAYAQRTLREDIVDKVLKRDIPALYNIRSIVDLEKIFIYLCMHSSSIISIDTISKELGGVTRPTVEKYIQYLASANMIYISNPIDVTGKKILKARPKIYIADAAIRNAVLMKENLLTDPTEMGIVAETAVYKHVRSFYYNLSANVGYYRRSTGKDNEIDIVVDYVNTQILIEVKYRENYSFNKNAPIITEAENASRALVITKKENDYGPLEENPLVYRIPAYAFLYLLGHAEKCGYKMI